MTLLTRRKTLQIGGVAFASGIAGCSTFGQQSSPPLRLGGIDVHNFDPRPHSVHVAFFDDGKSVYRASKDVPADHESSPGFASFENYPTRPDEDALRVWIDDQPKSDRKRFDFGERNASCLGLLITIGNEIGTDPGSVTIWHSTSENECEGMTETTEG
ncbi:hypothetical protein [Haladaptatus sp.]|uniref:hypothetical protein n=1 Tax=Haladaptatus sp. TaxID=1973141 RepID=UPI003C54A429